MEDPDINELLKGISRPHSSGGVVIERAAILASGADFTEVMDWILAHEGAPDVAVSAPRGGGLHGARMRDQVLSPTRVPLRFVLPAGTLH